MPEPTGADVFQVGASAQSAPVTPKKKPELQHVPNKSRLIIEEFQGNQFLVDTVLFHRQQLPAGSWEIVDDEDQWCALVKTTVDQDEDGTILAEDFMTKSLWEHCSGELFCLDSASTSKPKWSLTEKCRDTNRPASLSLSGKPGL